MINLILDRLLKFCHKVVDTPLFTLYREGLSSPLIHLSVANLSQQTHLATAFYSSYPRVFLATNSGNFETHEQTRDSKSELVSCDK